MAEQRNVSLEEDYRKISELYIKEQQKVGELEQINQNLTRQLMIYEGAARLREEHIHRLELSVAHAIFRWASATRVFYKIKGYSGLAERYERIHRYFKKKHNELKKDK